MVKRKKELDRRESEKAVDERREIRESVVVVVVQKERAWRGGGEGGLLIGASVIKIRKPAAAEKG